MESELYYESPLPKWTLEFYLFSMQVRQLGYIRFLAQPAEKSLSPFNISRLCSCISSDRAFSRASLYVLRPKLRS